MKTFWWQHVFIIYATEHAPQKLNALTIKCKVCHGFWIFILLWDQNSKATSFFCHCLHHLSPFYAAITTSLESEWTYNSVHSENWKHICALAACNLPSKMLPKLKLTWIHMYIVFINSSDHESVNFNIIGI